MLNEIAPREFSVSRADFPIMIEIEAKGMNALQAVPSTVLVTDDEINLIDQFDLPMARPDNLNGTMILPSEQQFPNPVQMHLTIVCGFATAPATSASPQYEIRIQPSQGEGQSTTVHRPTAPSARAHLVFHRS